MARWHAPRGRSRGLGDALHRLILDDLLHYEPDPETYLGTAELLGIAAGELMLVACHPDDLRAARAVGCRTGCVERTLELGPARPPPRVDDGEFDVTASDFVELADRLGNS